MKNLYETLKKYDKSNIWIYFPKKFINNKTKMIIIGDPKTSDLNYWVVIYIKKTNNIIQNNIINFKFADIENEYNLEELKFYRVIDIKYISDDEIIETMFELNKNIER